MPPDYCPAHGELMRSLGAVEAHQEELCKDLKEIKGLLQEKAKEEKVEDRVRVEMNTKTKIILAAIATVLVAAISAGISSGAHYLIVKVFGH